MRRISIALLAAVASLAGCHRYRPVPMSSAFQEFSLGGVIERMSVPGFRPAIAMVEGGSGIDPTPRRGWNLVFQIERPGEFNETRFIERLKRETEGTLRRSGARLGDSSGSNDEFNLEYTAAGHVGWVEVVGARMPGDQYKVWGVIHEASAPARAD
ncbi:MAG TPA: hypothetical protein VF771_16405 [Longimicrobiaceae bacterium]